MILVGITYQLFYIEKVENLFYNLVGDMYGKNYISYRC